MIRKKRQLNLILKPDPVHLFEIPISQSHKVKHRPQMPIMSDTGLMANQLGVNTERMLTDAVRGPLLENFVAMELCKQAAWSRTIPRLFHYRTQAGQEVDVVMEDAAGRVVGVEVKASSRVASADFTGLRHLAETAGKKFIRGVVLYTGEQDIPFAKNLSALPIDSLWRME